MHSINGSVNDEDAIVIVIDRNTTRALVWLIAFLAELGHERAAIAIVAREYLHSMVVAINDEQETSMLVEHQAKRIVELPISVAIIIVVVLVVGLGTNRELDASIMVNGIVVHVFNCTLWRHENGSCKGSEATKELRERPHMAIAILYRLVYAWKKLAVVFES